MNDNQEQERLVEILKRVDMGAADHDDVIELAAALGLSKHFDRRFDDELTHTTDERIEV